MSYASSNSNRTWRARRIKGFSHLPLMYLNLDMNVDSCTMLIQSVTPYDDERHLDIIGHDDGIRWDTNGIRHSVVWKEDTCLLERYAHSREKENVNLFKYEVHIPFEKECCLNLVKSIKSQYLGHADTFLWWIAEHNNCIIAVKKLN